MQGVGEVDWNPASAGSDTWDRTPSADLGKTLENYLSFLERERDPLATSTTSSRGLSHVNEVDGSSSPNPMTLPSLASPSLSVRASSSPSLSVDAPPAKSSPEKNCAPSQALPVAHKN